MITKEFEKGFIKGFKDGFYQGVMQGLREALAKNCDTTVNLCDNCEFFFGVCNNGVEGIDFFFGDGLGNDNIWYCKTYLKREE